MYSEAKEEEVTAHRELERRREERKKERTERKRLKAEMKKNALSSVEGENLEHPYSSGSSSSEDEDDFIPPCVRVIVEESLDPKVTTSSYSSLMPQVRPGSLFLVTVDGGSIGSIGQPEVKEGEHTQSSSAGADT